MAAWLYLVAKDASFPVPAVSSDAFFDRNPILNNPY